jgi:small subunit ribosomal protein S16
MAVVIRMMRAGAKKRPFYRVVVADSRRQRDGRFVEIVGYYDPIAKPYALKLDKDKILAWIQKGAQPSEQAASLLRMENIAWGAPSKPRKKPAAAAAKKVARAKPRKKTERKAKAKVARAKKRAKIAARAVAPKESKKKKS